jgi:hypothetical protein
VVRQGGGAAYAQSIGDLSGVARSASGRCAHMVLEDFGCGPWAVAGELGHTIAWARPI